jgi:predicted alpha/beta-fold hydrolase
MLLNVIDINMFDPRDLLTDVYVGFGALKTASRYRQAEQILKHDREKYKPHQTTLTGHSLGASIVSYLGSKGAKDKIITLDKGAAPFQKTRNIKKPIGLMQML